jgi:prolipoprotein diacylglyceryltransferase
VVALTGCLIRLGNFINSEIEGLPTNGKNGVVFARVAEDIIQTPGLINRNGIVEDVEVHRDDKKESYKPGIAPLRIEIDFSQDVTNESALKSILENDLRNVLSNTDRRYDFSHVSRHIYQPSNEPLNYDLKNTPNGFQANVYTGGIIRHPAQLYESISSLLLFVFLFFVWNQKKEKTPEGWIFGLFLVILWSLRFLYEFIKENQVPFEDTIPLNMGQWLSIPLILAGFYVLYYSRRNHQGTGS